MPLIKSAIKRAKQTARRRERNINTKRSIKNVTKAFLAKPAANSLSQVQSELDKAVKKGLLKKNTVARRKSQLAKVAKDAGVKLAATKKVSKQTATKKSVAKTKTTTKKVSAKKPVAKTTKTTTKKPPTKKTA